MRRRLRIDEMVPGTLMEGSQMSMETLTLDVVAMRVRTVVGSSFKTEEVNLISMRTNHGHIPLVSIGPSIYRSSFLPSYS